MSTGPKISRASSQKVVQLQMECMDMMMRAYQHAIEECSLDRNSKEDNITKVLCVRYLEKLKLENQWSVNPQVPIYNDDHESEEVDANSAPKPDLKFEKYFGWYGPKPFEFYIEAKNISETDWEKSIGSNVIARKQQQRYIDTGIDNFKSVRYRHGCLAAYVVQGDSERIVEKLNARLEKAERKEEKLNHNAELNPGTTFLSYHRTINENELPLYHLFFKIP